MRTSSRHTGPLSTLTAGGVEEGGGVTEIRSNDIHHPAEDCPVGGTNVHQVVDRGVLSSMSDQHLVDDIHNLLLIYEEEDDAEEAEVLNFWV